MRLAFTCSMNGQLQDTALKGFPLTRNYSSSVCDDDTPPLYREALVALKSTGVPFLIGGTYALSRYTRIERFTKDLDLFVMRKDCPRALRVLADLGCRTEITFRHWLAKATRDEALIDVIYASGNGVAVVDEDWFTHAVEDSVCGTDVLISPPEELLWSKAFVMERERYDGADVLHVIHGLGPAIEWQRLLSRFGEHWRVLLGHLVLYGFVYPSERSRVPRWVMKDLTARLMAEGGDDATRDKACLGTLLSRQQYLPDIDRQGYADGRLVEGVMNRTDIAAWTAAIDEEM